MKKNLIYLAMITLFLAFTNSNLYSQDEGLNENDYIENAMDFMLTGNYENALKEVDKAITMSPKFISAFIFRGDIKMQMKDYKGAMQDYNKAIDIEPNDPEAYKARGNVKVKLSDFTGAVNDYTLAIEKNSADAEAYNLRGMAMAGAGNYEGALKDYNNALELNPKYSEAFANKADAMIHLAKYIEAIRDCNTALSFTEIAEAYYYRGLAKVNLGDKMGGCLDMSKAGELGFNEAYTAIKKHCQ